MSKNTLRQMRRAIAAGTTEGLGLRLVESAGAVLVVVPTPRGDVIVSHDGEWREGFEDGPWIDALDTLLAGLPRSDNRAMRQREREHDAAVKAVEKAVRKAKRNG